MDERECVYSILQFIFFSQGFILFLSEYPLVVSLSISRPCLPVHQRTIQVSMTLMCLCCTAIILPESAPWYSSLLSPWQVRCMDTRSSLAGPGIFCLFLSVGSVSLIALSAFLQSIQTNKGRKRNIQSRSSVTSAASCHPKTNGHWVPISCDPCSCWWPPHCSLRLCTWYSAG